MTKKNYTSILSTKKRYEEIKQFCLHYVVEGDDG
jgi:hypothetical protein